ncbi:transporter [Endozoicomonas sp. OPT23]|uniref:AEC family transporter n=1 Tax=Endozoicomonas sp. OPT23 TaxID=2072845 RepID=UPI00129B365A|nr:AEC family transporter [Endozoicomonas sp. OPT23]MRI33235.1 transporter [Endozoicomonas sp. OPT23]
MEALSLLLERIFLTVFPLVAIVSTGFFYARRHNPDMTVANQVNIDVFVPALIFAALSAESFDLVKYQSLAIGAAIVVLGSGVLLLPFCKLLKVHPKTFIPPMMFSNSGNLGIPLIVLAFGEHALQAAVILFLVENVLHFTVGIYILDHKTRLLNLLRMPMILATILGLIWSGFDLPIYKAIHTFIEMLGQIAIPLMLFALGVRMTSVDFSNWKIGVSSAVLCPISGVVIALICQQFLQLDATQFAYLVVFGALPPAVLNYMIAERYNQEPHQVASIVLLGNIGSLLFIPLVLGFVL